VAAEMNHTVVQGDDFTFETSYYEADDTTPIDITGWKFAFTVKPAVDADDTDAAAYIAVDTADMTIDKDTEVAAGTVLNRVSFRVHRDVVKLIPVGTYPCDFQVIDDADNLLTHGVGDFVVEAQPGRRVPV